MTDDLTEKSLEEALEAIAKYQNDSGKTISFHATKLLFRPSDFPHIDPKKLAAKLKRKLND